MSFIFDQTTRPNRLTSDKNSDYHLQMAKYCLYSGYNNIHTKWLKSIEVNKNFYKGDQWTKEEDIATFLMDTSGNVSGRIKFVQNVIRPMVEQYRGNSIILNVNAVAKSISREAVNRRDKRLSEQVFKTKVANEFPAIGKLMKEDDISIGNDEKQTTTIFDNIYVDKLTQEINDLLNFSKRFNKFEQKQVKVALDLALSGLGVQQSVFHGGHQRFETVESEDFFFDRDAREFDLSDAEFQGVLKPYDVPLILERWQLDPKDAKIIEDYTQNMGNESTNMSGAFTRRYSTSKLPVCTAYWKDSERHKYGWVLDEDDYPVLVRIGERKGENELDNVRVYTEEDLITPPDTPKNKRLFPNGKKTAMLYYDVLRYCSYIPSEIVSRNSDKRNKLGDIVLEFGMEPYQDTNYQDLSNVKFPFKCYTWGYVNGEIFSPVDDAIDPQRFMNRMLSLTEARFNSSGGSNVILDEDSVDNPAKAYSDIKEGKPLTVRTRGKGVPNTVGIYDATPKQGAYNMFSVITEMNNLIQQSTGVNEGLKGESTGSDQLVGVTKLMIQRGSIMQEPFYNALSNVFLQMFDCVASVGKKFYIDNDRELSIIAGDDATKVFKLSEEVRNEDFLIFVERENPEDMLINQANQTLMAFKEMGLVDDVVFTNLYNRSTPEKVMADVRSYARIKQESARRAEEEALAMEEQAMQQQQQMMQQETQRQDQKDAQKEMNKLKAVELQNEGKINQIMTKSLLEGSNQPANG